jgi:hypothetical protein
MTIGIFRRIGDYGITIRRFYLLLLNIWFYGIYAYLFIIKSQRIKWILISPVVIALFFSIGFWSIPNMTKRIITSELNNYLDNKKIDISDTTFFEDMGQKEKDKIRDKFEYLYNNYGKESIQVFFNDSIPSSYIYTFFNDIGLNNYDYIEEDEGWVSFSDKYNKIWYTEEFAAFVHVKYNYIEYQNIEYLYKDGQFGIKIVQKNRVLYVPLKEMMTNYMKDNTDEVNYRNKDYIFMVKEFSGYYNEKTDSLDINTFEGYLFYNR